MPADSYELLFQVKQQGEAALDAIEAKLRGVDNAGKTASTSVDNIGNSAGRAAGPVSQLATQLRAAVESINTNTASLDKLSVSLETVGTITAPAAGAGLRSMGRDAMYASAALRELDGSMNMRAGARFLTDVLGLGPALRVLFPVISAAAFVGVIDQIIGKVHNLYEEYSPLGRAVKDHLDTIRETSAAYDELIKKANKLRLEEYERAHGREARQQLEAGELEGKVRGPDQGLINFLRAQIAEQEAILKGAAGSRAIPNPMAVGATTAAPYASTVAQHALDSLKEQLRNAQLIQSNDQGQADLDNNKAADERQKKAAEAAKKALAEITAAEKQAAAFLREAQTSELSGIDKIIEKRRQLLELYGKTAKAIADINRGASIDIIHEAKKESENWFNDHVWSDNQQPLSKVANKDFSKQLHENLVQSEKDYRNLSAALDRYDKADANDVKRQADKALRIADLTAGNGAGGQNIANDSAYRIRIALAEKLFAIESQRVDRLDDEDEKEKALAQARLDYEDQLDKARTDHEIKFLELQKKDLDEVHNLASGFYDAIRRGGTGVQEFFSNQVQGIGRTLFSNAFTEGYKAIGSPSAGGLIPGQVGADGQLTAIGRILQGTPFGTNGKDAQAKNTSALTTLTASVERLTARLSGKDPGAAGASGADNMPVPGMVGVTYSDLGQMTQAALASTLTGSGEAGAEGSTLPTAGSPGDWAGEVSSGNSILKALAGGYGGFTGSLSRVAKQGPGALLDAITGDSGDSGAERAGVIAGAGATLATGVTGVIQGIDQGGARGTLGAVASGAGTIAALSGPTPVAAIAGAVAAAAALVKGLLGDPRQERSLYEERALRDNQYFAPPTISRTTDQYGNEAGYNFMGQAHSLPFQTFSEVMPYDKYYKMPFGSGVPNVWGEVPGQIIEPYDSPQSYDKNFTTPNGINGGYAPQQTIVNLVVHAIDAQSFSDAINRNSSSVASATSKEIKLGHPVGMAIQQAVFGT